MARAIVTPELADTLRSIRLQNKITAKSLAEHIKKSPAYISKLESGKIQTIDNAELYSILQFVSCGNNDSAVLAEQIYASLKFKYSKQEIDEQLWFVNFDTVERKIPIPVELVNEINRLIKDNSISRQHLLMRINANESLSKAEIDDTGIPFNQWYHPHNREGNSQSIKIRMTEEQLDAILDKDIDVSPYIFILCVLYYVLKSIRYSEKKDLADVETKVLMDETISILNEYKFFSITERENLITANQSKDELSELLSTFDNEIIEILNDIIGGFQFASEYNIKDTNAKLKKFGQNMHWDLGFMLRIVSLDFESLEKTNVSNKRKLIESIEALIKEYSSLPDSHNLMEIY